jgi:hypothetical protein
MTANANKGANDPVDETRMESATRGARRAAAVAGGVAGEIADRLPEAAASSRSVLDQTNTQLQASSDEMLIAGAGLSLGVALGLGAAGASRLLVVLALIPAGAMAATLRERRASSTPAANRRRAR